MCCVRQPFGQKGSFFIKKYVPTMDEIRTHRQKKPSDTYEGHLMADFDYVGLKIESCQVCVKYITSAILMKAT